MAEFPALPLFTDSYLADTRHLSTEEHGAYLLLLMEAWRRADGSLPDDDLLLARLAGLSRERWAEAKPVVMAFWKRDGRKKTWSQKRLEKERLYVREKRQSAKDAAASRWKDKKKDNASAKRSQSPHTPPHTTYPSDTSYGGGGSARDANLPDAQEADRTDRERVLEAIGVGPDGIAGPSKFLGGQADVAELHRWLTLPGITVETACAEIARIIAAKPDGPPSSFKYFTPAMQRLSGKLSEPPLAPSDAQQPKASPAKRLWNLDPKDFNPDGSLRQ